MPLLRHIPLACPTCGHQGRYALEPTEDRPLVALVRCEACATPCGVEVRLTVTIETSVCRLALPSTTPVEPAATAAGGAIPPAPAYEARTLTPEVQHREDGAGSSSRPPWTRPGGHASGG